MSVVTRPDGTVTIERRPVDKRRLRTQTLQRYACWSGPEWTGLMFRSTGVPMHQGPVVQLELGDRVAAHILNPRERSDT